MSSRVAVIDARKELADILNRAAYGKERVVLTRRGKDVVAIVPMDDLAALEAMEDRIDVDDSRKVMARVRSGKEKLIGLDHLKTEFAAPGKSRPKRK